MRPLAEAPVERLRRVSLVLTDMDDTLTHRGRLSAATYAALERLEAAGIPVIPVTAAPAGWCDQMARMWPVAGVIGENGGLHVQRQGVGGAAHRFWHGNGRAAVLARLRALADEVIAGIPGIALAPDQPFRLTGVAFERPADPVRRGWLLDSLRAAGADVTVNSLWVLAWSGGYDKLSASRRFLAAAHGVDIDARREEILYVGDSANDAPMFAFFPNSVGVSTVTEHLADLPMAPAWITRGPGGQGFVEAADAVLAARLHTAERV
ncbi:HAD family hydrolase [Azospirillum sp. TSO22-1]|uniref:HAD family hydrolase n=1 Tax=Azospirillum sp. TSO22-1 TaxID=716789 RepID=UPI000D605C35|nr:HAD family hydrolase [Azospirillum sp. TSO22-1]PWC40361.1 HAD family hydrolase [Azospirillum sp. TSO22-1]